MSEKSRPQQGQARPERPQRTLAEPTLEETEGTLALQAGSAAAFATPPDGAGATDLRRSHLHQLQQIYGNTHVQRLLGQSGQAALIQRDDTPTTTTTTSPGPTATAAPAAAPAMSADDAALGFQADAEAFFVDNMEMELRNSAAIEAVAIGRRASAHAGQLVRDTCEPFERDQ
jgi:hypothetical protein